MARPKHDNPDIFTAGELAEATGLSPRNLQFLRDNRLGPFAARDQTGGTYGEDTLAEVAMIAGSMEAGFGVMLSAALVTAFLAEGGAHSPARFCYIDHAPDIGTRAGWEWLRGRTWFSRYWHLCSLLGEDLTNATNEDQTIYIADRKFVLAGTRGKPGLRRLVEDGIDADGPFALGKMEGLKRGSDPEFTPFWEGIGYPAPDSPELVAAEIEFQRAAQNSLALVAVNLSLSVRRAFAQVKASRQAKGGPFWEQLGRDGEAMVFDRS